MATWSDVLAVTADLPGIVEGTSYGTPALRVRKKLLCRMWSDREHGRDGVHDTEVLVLIGDLDSKDLLIESSDGVLFSTPHYEGHGALLVRLGEVDRDALSDHLEDSYRLIATKTLLKELDGRTGS